MFLLLAAGNRTQVVRIGDMITIKVPSVLVKYIERLSFMVVTWMKDMSNDGHWPTLFRAMIRKKKQVRVKLDEMRSKQTTKYNFLCRRPSTTSFLK